LGRDLFKNGFEVAQAGDGGSGLAVAPGDILSSATEQQRLFNPLQRDTLFKPVPGEPLVGERKRRTHTGSGKKLLLNLGHIGRLVFGDRLVGFPVVRPIVFADLDEALAMGVLGHLNVADSRCLKLLEIGSYTATRLAKVLGESVLARLQRARVSSRVEAKVNKQLEGAVHQLGEEGFDLRASGEPSLGMF